MRHIMNYYNPGGDRNSRSYSVGLVILYVLQSGTQRIKETNGAASRGLLLGSLGGMTALVFYGMMSYPFHLPATCLSFLFLLSVPTITSNSEPQTRNPKLETGVPSWFRMVRLTTLIILLIVGSIWILCPLLSEIYFRQGKIERMLGNRDVAIDDFEIASRLSDHADAEYNLGELLYQEGQIEEALKVFQQCAHQRKDKNIYNALANIYFFKKDYPKAIEYWKY